MCFVARGLPLTAATLFMLGMAVAPAWAYFDPGTGSMLLQLLIGGIAGSLFVVKLYFGRFKSFLLRRPQKPQQ